MKTVEWIENGMNRTKTFTADRRAYEFRDELEESGVFNVNVVGN